MSRTNIIASDRSASLVRAVCRCDSYAKVASEILQPVADSLRATSAVFFQFSMQRGQPVSIEHMDQYGGFGQLIADYCSQLYRTDPLFLAESDRPITLREIARDTRHTRTNIDYQPYFSALNDGGIGDIIGVYHKGANLAGDCTLHLSFQREQKVGDFNREDLETLCALSPVLQAVLWRLACAEDVHNLDTALTAIAANQKMGFELVNHRSSSSHAWRHGESIVGDYEAGVDGVLVDAPGLASHMSFYAKDLHESVNLARFGLTQRELEIVRVLRAGHSNLSTAHKLDISVRTVENHIRSIFFKVGVNSRTQLLAKLSN